MIVTRKGYIFFPFKINIKKIELNPVELDQTKTVYGFVFYRQTLTTSNMIYIFLTCEMLDFLMLYNGHRDDVRQCVR